MDATRFALNVSLPSDTRFLPAMRDLAIHAARYAGCHRPDANSFGAAVETVVSRCVPGPGGRPVPVIVRRSAGPVEVLVACDRRFDVAASGDAHITIEWVHEDGRQMCRVSRAMPQSASQNA